jgi:hypothetical protein
MQFTLTIECNNQAFADNPLDEIHRLLEDVMEKLRSQRSEGVLVDYYGNTVGKFELTREPRDDDQDMAENLCQTVSHLQRLMQFGGASDLEEAFREYVADNEIDMNVDNVDFDDLMES